MQNKKIMILTIIITLILAISAVSATENLSHEFLSTDVVTEDCTTDELAYVSDVKNDDLVLDENENVLNSNSETFTNLNRTINDNKDDNVYLDRNYTFEYGTDDNFKEGIIINRDVTIWGNGFTLDGNYAARIFSISNGNVVFHNITFINGKTTTNGHGGAINDLCTAINCTFINNHADYKGGAMYGGIAINCNFTNNSAVYGGAMYDGIAINCNFTNNSASSGGAMYEGIASKCNFLKNFASYGGAIVETVTINSTFINNNAVMAGAAYQSRMANCKFENNHADDQPNYFDSTFFEVEYGKTFSQLNNLLKNGNSEVYLDDNYYFDLDVDYKLLTINLNEPLTLHGNGFTLNGNTIFNLVFSDKNLTFNDLIIKKMNIGAYVPSTMKNCTFISNSNSKIYSGKIIGCKFLNNNIFDLEHTSVINCNFSNNVKTRINEGIAINCTFKNNGIVGSKGEAEGISIIYKGSAFNCTFISNYASSYGGAMNEGSAFNCTFIDNHACQGGAVYNVNTVNCTFINNSAIKLSSEFAISSIAGGAMYSGSAFKCTFIGNNANEGGAIYDGSAINCTFTNNYAYQGGAVHGLMQSPANVTNCTFLNNRAAYGGGGAICNGNAFNCIFKYNLAWSDVDGADEGTCGGAMFFGTAENCIFENNKAMGLGQSISRVKDINCIFIQPLIIKAPTVSTTYNINKYLIITLKDSRDKPAANFKVSVSLDSIKTYTSDNNGIIKIKISNLVPKLYKVNIIFLGQGNNLKSSLKTTVNVKKATPKLTASKKNFKKSVKIKKYTITLKTNTNNVMKKTGVTLKVNKKVYNVKTNNKGKAIFKITNLKKKGKFNAIVTYKGDKYYYKITKKVKITVK